VKRRLKMKRGACLPSMSIQKRASFAQDAEQKSEERSLVTALDEA